MCRAGSSRQSHRVTGFQTRTPQDLALQPSSAGCSLASFTIKENPKHIKTWKSLFEQTSFGSAPPRDVASVFPCSRLRSTSRAVPGTDRSFINTSGTRGSLDTSVHNSSDETRVHPRLRSTRGHGTAGVLSLYHESRGLIRGKFSKKNPFSALVSSKFRFSTLMSTDTADVPGSKPGILRTRAFGTEVEKGVWEPTLGSGTPERDKE
ncbi:uncharacterized protein LOC123783588 isoform X3 [Ursus americanus]|uniref:uncharacterized protein LOC123783588 isoform X3 n=1 Tax=Ursus americanus TaxID=9643 RepID=UPI001E67B11B|nr:uncharacterized protein LOC123783588 isoform X3 [Ursus americanus]XP_045640384.1 uncharacterized protein LOC123783588 isoform X3 [Ursus americanus]XP_045640385.1 uncharacterized protein LOC123783588 isoform X3 [Ursus americanus]